MTDTEAMNATLRNMYVGKMQNGFGLPPYIATIPWSESLDKPLTMQVVGGHVVVFIEIMHRRASTQPCDSVS